ncbi:MAG: hypothetical protein ABIK68_04650, partial [bacterium]
EKLKSDERVKQLSIQPMGRAVLKEIQGKKDTNNQDYLIAFSSARKGKFLNDLVTVLKSVSLEAE